MNYHCKKFLGMCNFDQVIDLHGHIFAAIDIHNLHRDAGSSWGTVFEIKTYEYIDIFIKHNTQPQIWSFEFQYLRNCWVLAKLKAFSEVSQKSKMELFAKVINCWKLLINFCQKFHLSCFTGLYASEDLSLLNGQSIQQ